MISIGLVILVVFLFLRSVRSTSASQRGRAHFAHRHLRGDVTCWASPSTISPLMALTVAWALWWTTPIVVVENITRHLENGMKPCRLPSTAPGRSVRPTGVHQHLPGGCVHPDPAHGRAASWRASLPRFAIAFVGHRHFHGHLPDDHADDVFPAVAIGEEEHQGALFQASERLFQRVMGHYEHSLGWVLRRSSALMVAHEHDPSR